MTVKIIFEFIFLAFITSGAARWIKKFIDTIKAGGYDWIQNVVAFCGAIGFGVWIPIYAGVPQYISVYIVLFLALIQYGYEFGIKTIIELFSFIKTLLKYGIAKWTVVYDTTTTSPATTDTTAETTATK